MPDPMTKSMLLAMIKRMSKPPTGYPALILLVLTSSLGIGGCRLSATPEPPPVPFSQKISWVGSQATAYTDSLPPGADSLETDAPIRFHRFEFAGSDTVHLRLTEYREGYWAYAAFQRFAQSGELANGLYRDGDTWIILHGSFLGALKKTPGGPIPSEFLKENLRFQGEEWMPLPKEFQAFPLLGRIPHSERVITRHFLGHQWKGPVFTVAYRCHGDSATAFRAFAQNFTEAKGWLKDWNGKRDTLDWGREIHFQGLDEFRRPLIFWIFSEGIMGFEGCFDTVLAQEYAEKMEKTAILWPKP